MPEPNVKRYPISTPAPRPFKLSDFGMARDQDGGDLTFETTIRGEVSLEEFRAMFGPDRNIVGAMAYSSTSRDGWACHRRNEHHAAPHHRRAASPDGT